MQTRRSFLTTMAGAAALATQRIARGSAGLSQGIIPQSGESLPAIGLGSWITFDVSAESDLARSTEVMRRFFDLGGGMIDSSPMYGQAQQTIGEGLGRLDMPPGLFSATKVWIPGVSRGQFQMQNALELWGVDRLDLVHVHNLVDWQNHLPWMREWQAEGRIRYLGVTTSHGRRHSELLDIMRTQAVEFVQFTYNLADREAEERLLPAALEHGKAVVINRPFQGGYLFRRVSGQPLPDWAGEIGCENWAQFFLKFIVSHPAVTCAIPATSQPDHLVENMGAMKGVMPDADMRAEMIRYFDAVT